MKVLYIKESLFSSIVKDTYTFSCLGGLWYLNHTFCGGSVIIDLFVGLFVIIGAIGLGKKRYYPREALDVLREIASLEAMEKTGTSANKSTTPAPKRASAD
jgi:hypothetical protein